LLIKSFHDLKLQERGLKIIVAGSISDKKYYNKIKDKINQFGVSDFIIFLGNVEKEDLRELYSKCKIFVFTSPFENFAYTLVEAMSCAAPIIATNTTAMPETCGNAALYFSPDSEEELSKCILTFLKNEKTRLKYKEMAFIKSNNYDLYSEVNIKTSLLIKKIFNN
jgi:glycosyltransferase involved in cell wall biosynthesis